MGLLKDIPADWGPKFKGQSGSAALSRIGPNSIEYEVRSHMALVMLTPQAGREFACNSDRRLRFRAPAGSLEIFPANTDICASWNEPKKSVLVAFEPSTLAEMAGLDFDRVDFELHPPRAGLVDERAKMFAEMISSEMETGKGANSIYLDALFTVFSMHLLRNYSSAESSPPPAHRGGLAARAWRNVIDYIHAHLQDELPISELARVAGLSTSHFLRAFRQTAGQPPHRYIVDLRLRLAKQLIETTTKPLPEIAQLTGFSSHSHLSSSMRRHWATKPSEMRRSSDLDIQLSRELLPLEDSEVHSATAPDKL